MTPRGPAYSAAHHGDERLRSAILRRLAHEDLSAPQLAERLGCSARSLHHTLSQLAAAGLVERAGRDEHEVRWRALPAKGDAAWTSAR